MDPTHLYLWAGWINMSLGMEVGLGPGHIVLDGDPAHLPKRGHSPSNFRLMSVVAKRLDGSKCHLRYDTMDYINVRPKGDE